MLAEMVFAGAFIFSIPPAETPDEVFVKTGGCTVQSSFNVFAVWPHQHLLGTHHKTVRKRNGVETVMHDAAYAFTEQNYYLQTPEVDIAPGDQIQTTCTWHNNTNGNVGWGESSNEEMCFSGLYRYPAQNEGIAKCTDTNGVGF
jgi:hypothetical protein